MRYYDIEITIPAEGASPERTIKYSSHKNGVYNPGALMIEFDILRYGESQRYVSKTVSISKTTRLCEPEGVAFSLECGP